MRASAATQRGASLLWLVVEGVGAGGDGGRRLSLAHGLCGRI
jgi:hypothetical protein